MNKTLYYILALVIMAGVTYLIRMLPMVIFKKKIKSPFINSLLYYLPYAVLSAMTFPFILYCSGNVISASVGTFVALIASFCKRSLVTVAILAVISVLLTQLTITYLIPIII
ncbi:MAG: AzlD domain-containing protein [Clostridia bacterium]|nr:AzlD domain-containing protein [Clostridia bacterium]